MMDPDKVEIDLNNHISRKIRNTC